MSLNRTCLGLSLIFASRLCCPVILSQCSWKYGNYITGQSWRQESKLGRTVRMHRTLPASKVHGWCGSHTRLAPPVPGRSVRPALVPRCGWLTPSLERMLLTWNLATGTPTASPRLRTKSPNEYGGSVGVSLSTVVTSQSGGTLKAIRPARSRQRKAGTCRRDWHGGQRYWPEECRDGFQNRPSTDSLN